MRACKAFALRPLFPRVAASLILGLAPTPAFAADDAIHASRSASALLRQCIQAEAFLDRKGPISTEGAMCIGFMQGFDAGQAATAGFGWHGLKEAKVVAEGPNVLFLYCGHRANLDQRIRVFNAYARAHPQNLHRSNYLMVAAAFMEAFPCDDIAPRE